MNCLQANALLVTVQRNYEPQTTTSNNLYQVKVRDYKVPGLMKAALSGLTSLLVVRQGTSASQIVSPVVGGKN